jgi:hypothetical protein
MRGEPGVFAKLEWFSLKVEYRAELSLHLPEALTHHTFAFPLTRQNLGGPDKSGPPIFWPATYTTRCKSPVDNILFGLTGKQSEPWASVSFSS